MSSTISLSRMADGACGDCTWHLRGSTLTIRPSSSGGAHGCLSSSVGCVGTWPWLVFSNIRKVVVLPGVSLPTKTKGLFGGLSKLEEVDISGFDCSQVRDLSGMFRNCKSLVKADLSELDFEMLKVVDDMFEGCESLISVSWPSSVPNLRSARHLFAECVSLKEVDLSALGTRSLRNVSHMLSGCIALRSICLDGWEATRLRDTSFMFDDCRSLADIPIADWDLSLDKDASFMFAGCASMVRIPVEHWDIGKCTNMAGMFSGCASLKWLTLSQWRPSCVVKSMHYMFAGCRNLFCVSLDGWEMEDPSILSHAFDECHELRLLSLLQWSPEMVRSLTVPRAARLILNP